MQRQQMQAAGTVVAAAVAGFIYYGAVLDVTFGGIIDWRPVVEGLLIGAVVLASWLFTRSRSAAAAGIAVVVALGLLGAVAFDPALLFFQTPVGWAVLLTLALRMAVPETRGASQDARERVAA